MKRRFLLTALLTVLFFLPAPSAFAPEGGGPDLIGDFNFTVEIEGLDGGAFQSVDGLSAEVEVIEADDGSRSGEAEIETSGGVAEVEAATGDGALVDVDPPDDGICNLCK